MLLKQRYQKSIHLSTTSEEREKIVSFRKKHYKRIYPNMNLDTEPLDFHSLLFYSTSDDRSLTGTARLAFDTPLGFPQEPFLSNYRTGKRLMEFGRYIVQPSDTHLLKLFYSVLYESATKLGYDAIIMAMKPKDISFHQRMMGLHIIHNNTGETYGGDVSLACVSWELNQTKTKFFNWVGDALCR